MKRLTAGLLVYLLLSVLTASFAFAADFGDISATYWAREEIAYMTERGIFLGQTRERFNPEGGMTRGQMTAVLYRLAGLPYTQAPIPYGDVPETAYYYDAVCWAGENGIFTKAKQDADKLSPDEILTRGEFAVMLHNYDRVQGCGNAPMEPGENPFTDMESVSGEVRTAILCWAYPMGILRGTSETTMNPGGILTRAHAAVMLCRYDRGTEAEPPDSLRTAQDHTDEETTNPAENTEDPTAANPAEDSATREKYMAERTEIIRLVNAARVRSGVREVSVSEALMDAAQAYAETAPLNHNHDLEVELPQRYGCYHGVLCNLYRGYGYRQEEIPERAAGGWERSRAHYLAMTIESSDSVGVGLYYDEATKTWFSAMFIGDCQTSAAVMVNPHR